MTRYHPSGDLAPRDVVARAIDAERRAGRGAFLDARGAPGAAFPAAFPTVFRLCMAAGIDPREQAIPVLPAAHYHMGGVETDAWGATSLTGLFAAGECAATGAHGANRLASNSLVEAAVFGRRAGQAARETIDSATRPLGVAAPPELAGGDLTALRGLMTAHAGVVRGGASLEALVNRIDDMQGRQAPALPLIAARLIAEAALARRESRGGHFREDFPRAAATAAHTHRTLAQTLRRHAA